MRRVVVWDVGGTLACRGMTDEEFLGRCLASSGISVDSLNPSRPGPPGSFAGARNPCGGQRRTKRPGALRSPRHFSGVREPLKSRSGTSRRPWWTTSGSSHWNIDPVRQLGMEAIHFDPGGHW